MNAKTATHKMRPRMINVLVGLTVKKAKVKGTYTKDPVNATALPKHPRLNYKQNNPKKTKKKSASGTASDFEDKDNAKRLLRQQHHQPRKRFGVYKN